CGPSGFGVRRLQPFGKVIGKIDVPRSVEVIAGNFKGWQRTRAVVRDPAPDGAREQDRVEPDPAVGRCDDVGLAGVRRDPLDGAHHFRTVTRGRGITTGCVGCSVAALPSVPIFATTAAPFVTRPRTA